VGNVVSRVDRLLSTSEVMSSEMRSWKTVLWRSELQKLIKDCLKQGDMTLIQLVTEIQRQTNTKIRYPALAAILKVTDGVVVTTKIFSEASNKMINVYSNALILNKKQE
jgi:hypothetical protein